MKMLEANGICKKIGNRTILDAVSFNVEEGEVFGFIGANGAGKTTTIKVISGLIKPDAGSVKIFGYDIQKERINALKSVGTIVENPEMYNYLSGYDNLKQCARLYGGIDKNRINEVIEIIGLKDRINDIVKKYSLGMKQRLGIGQAIINNPKLLILDEPMNGLDPLGIKDLKDIIGHMAKEYGTSVFISSHILSEIEQICSKVAFIDKGVIKSVENVQSDTLTSDIESYTITSKDINEAVKILETLSFVKDIFVQEKDIHFKMPPTYFNELIKLISSSNIHMDKILSQQRTLEDRFLDIVKGGNKRDRINF